MLQWRWKVLCATAKTWHSQIKKLILKKHGGHSGLFASPLPRCSLILAGFHILVSFSLLYSWMLSTNHSLLLPFLNNSALNITLAATLQCFGGGDVIWIIFPIFLCLFQNYTLIPVARENLQLNNWASPTDNRNCCSHSAGWECFQQRA